MPIARPLLKVPVSDSCVCKPPILVYLQWFRRHSLFKCLSQPGIAKPIAECPYFGVQGHPRSFFSVPIESSCTISYYWL